MSFFCREMQRTLAYVACMVDVCAVIEEKLCNLQMSPRGCGMQWSAVVTTPDIHVLQACHNQPFNHVAETTQCGEVQRGCRPLRVRGCPSPERSPLLINIPR